MGVVKKKLVDCLQYFAGMAGKAVVAKPTGFAVPSYLWSRILESRIDLCIDIGANEGQFASEMRQYGFKGEIHSFEPQPDVFQRLEMVTRGDSKWNCSRMAVGADNGRFTMHLSGMSPSSSLLPIGKLHTELLPDSAETGTIDVDVVTLDSWMERTSVSESGLFLKIDVQGYEMQVLKGAQASLAKTNAVLIELCFANLYLGQSKYYEVARVLEESGLHLVALVNCFYKPDNGDLLWGDGFFTRKT
jgi:FkbM family methyltransferase